MSAVAEAALRLSGWSFTVTYRGVVFRFARVSAADEQVYDYVFHYAEEHQPPDERRIVSILVEKDARDRLLFGLPPRDVLSDLGDLLLLAHPLELHQFATTLRTSLDVYLWAQANEALNLPAD